MPKVITKFCLECGHRTEHLGRYGEYGCMDKDHPRGKRYRVQNRISKASYVVTAASAQDACEKMGWMIGECFIREL